jgi:hypothetical protein
MATVPGPQPDRPLPIPGAPAEEPPREYEEEERREAAPQREGTDPSWLPEPYDPEREHVEPEEPAVLP